MDTTDVFTENLIHYRNKERLIINEGGSRSGKTYSILQLLLLIAMSSKEEMIITIVSRTLPHLKLGAIRDFERILLSFKIIPDTIRNKSESYYRINHSVIEYFGADQTDKVHGPGRDILFINEANFVKYEIYDQLSLRTSRTVFIDYNPTARFWIHDEVMPIEPHKLIKSTYVNNEYCPEGIRNQLDRKRQRYETEKSKGTITKAFENWCKVYIFGELGSLEGTILENWRWEEPGEVEEMFKTLPYGYGLDYGFFPDPDAMDKVAIDRKRKKVYIKEMIHANNNGTEELIEKINDFYQRNELIIAESASPRTNKDLAKHFNIKPVRKIRTVADWLREMQDYEYILAEGSENTAKEFQNYLWSDKKAGVPVDEWNHHIDAIRYYYMEIHKPKYF